MAQAEILAVQRDVEGLLETVHPQLLEERIGPDVVVAGAEPDLHACVHQADELRDHPRARARDHVAVFVPEVPDVAQQVERPHLLDREPFQEIDETRLALRGILHPQAEVHVGDEIDEFALRHYASQMRTAMPTSAQ